METWKLILRILQLSLVLITVLLARFGLGFKILQYGYDNRKELWPSTALKIGRSNDHWWLHTVLAYYLLIIPAIMVSEIKQPSGGIIKNFLMTLSGGILYIICGSATLNYYIPLASTDQYPRAKGLALGSLEMIAGVAMLVHCVVQVCLSGKYCNCKDIIVVDTKIPLYEPKNKLTRRPSTVKDSVSTKPEADDCNKNIYLGQIVYENFKPTTHINN